MKWAEVSEGVILKSLSTNLISVSIHCLLFVLPQTDLEMVVEDLAQKVNRPYLRTPCHKIISAARLVQQKRQEFLASVARGVAPNDSPELPRRKYDCIISVFNIRFIAVRFFFIVVFVSVILVAHGTGSTSALPPLR